MKPFAKKTASLTVLLCLLAPAMLIPFSTAADVESYTKECMPDFGQHSDDWCWVAALANSLYWYKHTGGYPDLYPDAWDTDIVPVAGCPNPAGGYRKLFQEIAIAAGVPFSDPIMQGPYLNAIQMLLDDFNAQLRQEHNVVLALHVIESPDFDPLSIAGPSGTYATLPDSINPDTLNPLIRKSCSM